MAELPQRHVDDRRAEGKEALRPVNKKRGLYDVPFKCVMDQIELQRREQQSTVAVFLIDLESFSSRLPSNEKILNLMYGSRLPPWATVVMFQRLYSSNFKNRCPHCGNTRPDAEIHPSRILIKYLASTNGHESLFCPTGLATALLTSPLVGPCNVFLISQNESANKMVNMLATFTSGALATKASTVSMWHPNRPLSKEQEGLLPSEVPPPTAAAPTPPPPQTGVSVKGTNEKGENKDYHSEEQAAKEKQDQVTERAVYKVRKWLSRNMHRADSLPKTHAALCNAIRPFCTMKEPPKEAMHTAEVLYNALVASSFIKECSQCFAFSYNLGRRRVTGSDASWRKGTANLVSKEELVRAVASLKQRKNKPSTKKDLKAFLAHAASPLGHSSRMVKHSVEPFHVIRKLEDARVLHIEHTRANHGQLTSVDSPNGKQIKEDMCAVVRYLSFERAPRLSALQEGSKRILEDEQKENHSAAMSTYKDTRHNSTIPATDSSTKPGCAPPMYDYGTPPVDSFDSMGMQDQLLRGVYAYGFEKPSKIQQIVIPTMLSCESDITFSGPKGTGKTCAYVCGTVGLVDVDASPSCQAIILVPSRLLAEQVHSVLSEVGSYKGIHASLLIGGTSVGSSSRELQRSSPHIVVGTCGRTLHMISSGFLDVSGVRVLVMDETDQLLVDTRNADVVYDIMSSLPVGGLRVVSCSMQWSPQLESVYSKMLREGARRLHKMDVDAESPPVHCGIRQFFVDTTKEEYKFDTLMDILEMLHNSSDSKKLPAGQTVVFVNSKRRAEVLQDLLRKHMRSTPPSCLHEDLDPQSVKSIMTEFRTGESHAMITTNTLCHGLDIPSVAHIVQYDPPPSLSIFLKRSGTCGRYGRKGVVITLLAEPDMDMLDNYYRSIPGGMTALPARIEDMW